MTFEEADDRLVAGWHVDHDALEDTDVLCSAQRKRYLRLERERILMPPDGTTPSRAEDQVVSY